MLARSDEEQQQFQPYQPEPEQTFFEKFSFKSLTFRISLFDIIIYLLTVFTLVYLQLTYVNEGMSDKESEVYEWGCVLYYWGAKYTPSIRYHYQFQRLLLPAILHGSPMHIIGNLILQLYYGFILETTHGKIRVSIVYIAGAIGGCLFSCLWHPYNIAVGASAAIFGLLSLEVVYFITNIPVIDKKRVAIFILIIPLSFLSFFEPSEEVDNSGHLGGMVMGLLIGLGYAANDSMISSRKFFLRKMCITFLCYFLALLVTIICLVLIYTIPLEDRKICPEI